MSNDFRLGILPRELAQHSYQSVDSVDETSSNNVNVDVQTLQKEQILKEREGRLRREKIEKKRHARERERKRDREREEKLARECQGPISKSHSERDVQRWLYLNRFDSRVCKEFEGFSGRDMLMLTKEDVISIIGAKHGIRLFNRMTKAQLQPYDAGSPNKSADIAEFRAQRAAAKANKTPHRQNNKKDHLVVCSSIGCRNTATEECAGVDCVMQVCRLHINRSLITSHIYCDACFNEPILQTLQRQNPQDYCKMQ